MKEIEIPFGAKDSELKGWEYTIPEGMEAEIKDGKIVVREKKPELTEFEQGLVNFYNKRNAILPDKDGVFNRHDCAELLHESAKELLELAKKEICKGCTIGLDQYWKGRADAMKEYEKPITYNYPIYQPPCIHGGVCTNPFKDCINCPRQSSGATINTTTSGTCKKD